MIEMKCPACGAEGRTPKDKINTRLVCRKCLKVFHLTPTGRAVLGEPPVTGTTSTARQPARGGDRTETVDQWLDRASKSAFSPRSLAIAGGLVLLTVVLAFFSMRPAETLQDQAKKVAEAAVQGDLRTVRGMAASGTNDEVMKWYESIQSRCDTLRQHLGSSRLIVEIDVRRRDDAQGSAETIARLDSWEDLLKTAALPDPSVPAPGTQSLALPMAWRSERWSGWRLDGKRSMEMAESMP